MDKKVFTARNITWFAVLIALVIVLQLFASSIKIGAVEFSLTLIPIVIGGMLLGPISGALLGFTFGLITLLAGVTGASAFTNILFTGHPVITSLTCIIKGAAAGFAAGILYRVIYKKNKYAATFVASAAAPIVNTGLFILGALFMTDTLKANFIADGETVLYFLIIGCAGVNFLIEFALNLVVSPAIYRVSEIIERRSF